MAPLHVSCICNWRTSLDDIPYQRVVGGQKNGIGESITEYFMTEVVGCDEIFALFDVAEFLAKVACTGVLDAVEESGDAHLDVVSHDCPP